MSEWSLSNMTYFLYKAYHNLAHRNSGAALQHYAWGLFYIAHSPTKSTEMWQTWHLIELKKDICLQYESRNKKAKHCLVQPDWACVCAWRVSNFLPLCTCWRMATKGSWVLIWGFSRIGKFTSAESMTNEVHWVYFYMQI